MTQEQIHQLFKHGYNQATWKKFLHETFTGTSLLANPDILVDIDSNIASKALKLGYILIDEKGIQRQIAIYEITLAKGIILERNRVGLRNLLRKYWKNIDAAFIVYHNPENNKWRFSYVSELTGYDSDGNYLKIQTEPKRYTYVLGEGESSRTASERFELVSKKGNSITLEDIKEAFSVEKLSKAFFDEYKIHYKAICDFMMKKSAIKDKIFNGNEKAIRDFSKKLLGRIVFLYFIQKKGWMGVPINGKWGEGDFNFLSNLFKKHANPNMFYTEVLTPLFFDTLNNEKRENCICGLIKDNPCKVPFLNGGLFEEEDKKHREIVLDAKLFNSLFDFFNQYNFTIYEDDPNDHTVAVDPEMLGHIFENLLEDNKDKGAYYTPKEIVHYMCQESLIEYLCTTLDIPDENAERRAIEELLKKKHIDEILRLELNNINDALDKVKICDPAIGSGAFPMGLLQEIFSVKETLWYFEHENLLSFPASEIKLNIIQNSIYGVDIEKGAVDIARLRFWLSLVVDEDEPKALPNLDYKIVEGDSLLSKLGNDVIEIDWNISETSHGLFGAESARSTKNILSEITCNQKKFFKSGSDKKYLSALIRNLKIDLLIHQLELMINKKELPNEPKESDYRNKPKSKFSEDYNKYLDTLRYKKLTTELKRIKSNPDAKLQFFDWNLDFPEVLNKEINQNPGFDIIIGNPPYVDSETMIRNQPVIREYITNKFNSAKGNWDLYIPFHEQAIIMLKENGIKSFITPSKWLSIGYANELRNLYSNQLYKICNCNNIKVFDAGVSPVISFFKKCNSDFFNVDIVNSKYEFSTSYVLSSKEIDNNSLGILLSDYSSILLKIKNFKLRFKDYLTCENPFSTSEAYRLCDILIDNIKPKQRFFKLINTGTIDPFVSLWGKKLTTYLKSRYTHPVTYVEDFKKVFPKRLQQVQSPKLIITGMRYLECFFDENGEYIAGKSTLIIREIQDNKFNLYCALLNSKLVSFYIKQSFSSLGIDGGVNFTKDIIEDVPLPKFSKYIEDKLSEYAQIMNQNDTDCKHIIEEMDNLIYRLYELTYDEVKLIDPELSVTKKGYEAIKLN